MSDFYEYRFRIDVFTPDTIPMSRLAEYMSDLSQLLGEKERVHFVRLDEGSTILVQKVETQAQPKVKERLQSAVSGEGPDDVIRAFRVIDRRLAQDNAVGNLYEGGGAEILAFPGRTAPQPLTFGAFNEQGSLDGMLIRIGGKDETVPVHIQDGDVIHQCNATREIARQLAPYLYGATLRVHGEGRWERDAEGAWLLKRFNIRDFETLDDAPLSDVVERLRQVPGNHWKEMEDPLAELQRLRQGHDEIH